jgi:Outer membrane protein beta-barrel domain
MNRRSILIASALLITAGVSTASAQAGMVPRTSFGVLGGVNFAKVSGNDVDGAKTRTGAVGGISLDFHLAPQVSLEIDGLYSQQGTKSDFDGDDLTLKLDYVQVPVLIKYRFPTHTQLRPFLEVGPYAAFRTKCDLSSGGETASCEDFFGEKAKSTDFGGTAGAGVGFKLGRQELSLVARYSMGFTKILSDSDVKNKVFSVLAVLSP